MKATGAAELVELRVLDGPNLYFTRPAVKVVLAVPGWLALPEGRAESIAGRVSRARLPHPGAPATEVRRRFVARIASHVTRDLAAVDGTAIGVRSRPGPEPGQIVVAFPWRRRGAAEALGREVARLMADLPSARRSYARLLQASAGRLRTVDPGPAPVVPDPRIPTVAVTGTNGKTTTVRLLAHLGAAAGLSVAYSCTDGVYRDGRLVEEGDYSGFGGAARALSQPGVNLAILETARGGILLRGIGAMHNDVAVVTNVSADHLDLQGIRTLDQLAEVKATITKITRPDGWDVLNADDPRVLAMRRGAKGRPWLFSLDPDHPAIRTTLNEGGRASTVIDGWISVLAPGSHAALVPLLDVPVTLAGISRNNTLNALASTSAALAVGIPAEAVVRGLRTFVLDEDSNPGRANLYELDERVVVLDYAHNEAGLRGMIEVCRGLCAKPGEVWLSFGTAGDRTDEILHGLGYTAARGADHVVVAELLHYLRGRNREALVARLRAGAIDGGATKVPVFEDELRALKWMLRASRPADVVAVAALVQRQEIFRHLRKAGAVRVGPRRVRQLVRRAAAAHKR
jgi:cyanophycin synthetase